MDLNSSISPSDSINCAAFLASFDLVSISSQLMLPKAVFLLSSSHVLFLFLIFAWHSVNICLADCIPCLYRNSSDLNPGTFLKCKNFLRPIFSVFIFMIRTLSALQGLLYSFKAFFVDFGQIVCNSLPVFSLDRILPITQRLFALLLT